MDRNIWAEPEGYTERAPTVAYRILDKRHGGVVVRHTEQARDSVDQRYYISLAAEDQAFADELAMKMQEACGYFYLPDGEYKPLQGWAESRVSDDEIRARIHRLNAGENARERDRVNLFRQHDLQIAYDFEALPWDQQRALIEEIDRIRNEWRFEIIGEVDEPPEPPSYEPKIVAGDIT